MKERKCWRSSSSKRWEEVDICALGVRAREGGLYPCTDKQKDCKHTQTQARAEASATGRSYGQDDFHLSWAWSRLAARWPSLPFLVKCPRTDDLVVPAHPVLSCPCPCSWHSETRLVYSTASSERDTSMYVLGEKRYAGWGRCLGCWKDASAPTSGASIADRLRVGPASGYAVLWSSTAIARTRECSRSPALHLAGMP